MAHIPAGTSILHVDSELTWRGGEQQLLYLMLGLRARNILNFLACPPTSALYREAQNRGLTVFPLALRGEWDFISALQLARLIKRLKVTILHCHSSHAHTIGFLSVLCKKDCTFIVTRRVDFPIGRNILSYYKYKKRVDKIIAVSHGIKNVLVKDGVKANKITVVHDGIDIHHFQCRERAHYLFRELGLAEGKPIIGNVAALAPHKDQQNLLAAAKIVLREIPGAQFIIAGEGKLEHVLKQQAKTLGIDKQIIFTGFRKDVPQLLTILDLFVVSSYLEGLGSSTLEAMASGLPIVATMTGGIPEIVIDGTNGVLVPPKDSRALANAILHLLASEKKRDEMRLASREKVKDFSVEKMVNGNMLVYSGLNKRR